VVEIIGHAILQYQLGWWFWCRTGGSIHHIDSREYHLSTSLRSTSIY